MTDLLTDHWRAAEYSSLIVSLVATTDYFFFMPLHPPTLLEIKGKYISMVKGTHFFFTLGIKTLNSRIKKDFFSTKILMFAQCLMVLWCEITTSIYFGFHLKCLA